MRAPISYDAAVSDAPDHAQPVLGIVLKLGSVVCLAAMAASVKYLGPAVPAGQAIFLRGAIAMLVIGCIAWRTEGLRILLTGNWRAHALRSVAGSISMFCWFTALTLIPLAEMTAISFATPLFLTVLAMLFLGERIHWYRWTALGIGFAGVSVMIAPQLGSDRGSALGTSVAMLAAVMAGFALMFLRQMSGREHALAITFYFFLTSTVLASLTWIFTDWPLPTGQQWVLLVMIGVFGLLGQLLMTHSYRHAEASLIAPLDYTSLLAAVAIGYYLFGEVPHVATWLGAPLVIAAGGIILWREYARRRAIRPVQRLPS